MARPVFVWVHKPRINYKGCFLGDEEMLEGFGRVLESNKHKHKI